MTAEPETLPGTADDDEQQIVEVVGWTFLREPPSVEEVKAKLATLPNIWGIRHADFWEFVQPLSQKKNVGTKQAPDWAEMYTLYFTVAGRIAMLNAAADKNGWAVSHVPESTTPTGAPGYLSFGMEEGERIVYREYTSIGVIKDGGVIGIGSKPGTAWVPATGGANAVQSNRYEKVETAARGRSIGAWGFGVLPGSGVASLEEMTGIQENRQAESGGGNRRQPRQRQARKREDVLSDVFLVMAAYKEATGLSDGAMDEKVIAFCGKNFGQTLTWGGSGALDFGPLKDGELVLLHRKLEQEVTKAKAEAEEL